MRAQFIYENIEFERGIEPRKAMKIGMMDRILQQMKEDDTWVWEYTLDDRLQWASREGNINYVKYLLSKGADIHSDEEITFQWAITKGWIELVKVLIDAGAQINFGGPISKDKAKSYHLRAAIETGHKDIVKLLLKYGAIIDNKAKISAKKHNMEDIIK